MCAVVHRNSKVHFLEVLHALSGRIAGAELPAEEELRIHAKLVKECPKVSKAPALTLTCLTAVTCIQLCTSATFFHKVCTCHWLQGVHAVMFVASLHVKVPLASRYARCCVHGKPACQGACPVRLYDKHETLCQGALWNSRILVAVQQQTAVYRLQPLVQ